MNKLHAFILLGICLFTGLAVGAQSPAQLKKLLTANVWRISHNLVNSKKESPDKSRQGASITFNKAGLVAIQFPADPGTKGILLTYEITDTYLVLGENIELPHYRYKFEDGYLFLTDADLPSLTTVWKQSEITPVNALAKESPTVYSTDYAPTPKGALPIIKEINDILQEGKNNLVFWNLNSKETVKDISFVASETGVRLQQTVLRATGETSLFVTDFVPEKIKSFENAKVDKASPLSYLMLKFEDRVCSEDISAKGSGRIRKLQQDFVYIPFLKTDEANYNKLKTLFTQLSKWYEDKVHRLSTLENHIKTGEKFWVSDNSISKTYGLYDVFVTGGTIKFYYTLETVGARGDSRGDFVTVVPLRDIAAVSFDKSKSKPNMIILKAGKYGFTTYSRKDMKADYENTGVDPVSELPLFIDVSNELLRERVMELLQTHVKELGGGKLKL